MAIVWDKATYDSMYQLPLWQWGVRNHPRVPVGHYHWFSTKTMFARNLANFLLLPGAAQVSDIAVIGGGFGWLCDLLAANGINSVSVDVSPYVLAEKDSSEEAEIRANLTKFGFDPDNLPVLIGPDYNTPVDPWQYWLRPEGKRATSTIVDEDMSTNTSRRAVRTALGSNIDAIVSEFAIDSVEAGDDAGSLVIAERVEQTRPNPACQVIHLVDNVGPNDVLNNKTKEQWKALLTANGFGDHYVVASDGSYV